MEVDEIYLPIEESLKTQRTKYQSQGKKWECMLVDNDLDTVKAVVQAILLQQSSGLIRMCAWCKKVWIGNTWRTIGDLMQRTFIGSEKVTHTICRDCRNTQNCTGTKTKKGNGKNE